MLAEELSDNKNAGSATRQLCSIAEIMVGDLECYSSYVRANAGDRKRFALAI